MSKFKDFIEFRKQFEGSIAYGIVINCLTQIHKKDMNVFNEIREDKDANGLDLKLVINGHECDFSEVLLRVDKRINQIEAEAMEIRDEQIEEMFKQKVSDKLYDIIDQLDNVDQVVKSCISWQENE